MADDVRTVNGVDVSWGSIILKLADGSRFYGFGDISYGHKLEETVGYGQSKSQAPTRRSRGKYSCEALKVKMYKNTAQILRKKLAALSGTNSYSATEFSGMLQFVEAANGASHRVEFKRLRYVSETASHSEGADLLVEELELNPLLILVDGLTLASSDPALD